MRASTIVVAGAALGLAASACWAQSSGALPRPVLERAISAQLAQANPAPRAQVRQALLVGGLRLGATQDQLARDVPPALERAGFGINNSRNDPVSIIAAVRRVMATGIQPSDIVVLARAGHSAAALEAAATLALPDINLVLIDGCPSLVARGQTLPKAHILSIATARMATGEPCGQPPAAGDGRPPLESVRLQVGPSQRGGERTEPDALARAIAGWIAPPQFPDDAN